MSYNRQTHTGTEAYTGSKTVPDSGDYTVLITTALYKTNKQNNGSNVEMTYSILNGPFQGTEIKEWLAVENQNETAQNIARSKIEAIFAVAKTNETASTDDLVGKTIRIRVIKEPNEYIDRQGNKRQGHQTNVVNYMDLENNNANGNPVSPFVAVATKNDQPTQSSNTQQSAQQNTSSNIDDDIPF